MDIPIIEWTNLIVRWIHVFTGILWVGTTYYFTWLDGRFSELEESSEADGQVWMVHSGGFYVVTKQKTPQLLPQTLHWFRWEAMLTWLSGILLLFIVYYHGGALVDDAVADISVRTGTWIGLGTIFVGWAVYDLLWQSRLANSEVAGTLISFFLLAGTAYGLAHLLSGRAAYMHVGALMGTLMMLNVWMRILPAQRKMVAALQEGRAADVTLGARAKQRSKHNTFMVVPVVFLMISNHFPTATYGSRYNWEILLALVLAGWGAAKIIRRA